MKTNNNVNPIFGFSNRGPLVALGILISIFTFNLSALAEINCQSLIEGSLQEKESPQEKYKKGYCCIKLEKFEEGLKMLSGLENELTLIADYVTYYNGVGEKELGNLTSAGERFRKILTEYPESGLRKKTLIRLAEVYSDMGNHEEAEKIFRSLYAEESDSWAKSTFLNNIGESLERQKKYLEALSTYKKLWVEFPESNSADTAIKKAFQITEREGLPFELKESDYLKRAERLFKLSRWKSALENFDKISEKTDVIELKIAISKYRLGLLDEASTILVGISSPESLYWMSKISTKFGRDEEASEILSQIPLFYPDSELAPEALYNAARLYQVNLNFEKAMELYDLLLRKYPQSKFSEEAAWNLGWIHYRSGRYPEAVTTFSSINSPQATYWKAKTLEKEGRKKEAFDIYESLARTAFPSYYSYLAQKRTKLIPSLDSSSLSTKNDVIKKVNLRKERAEFLIELGIFDDAILEIKEMEKESKSKWELLDVSALYSRVNDFYNSIRVAQGIDFPEANRLSYPLGFNEVIRGFSAKYGVDEFMVYSIIREESRFQKDAVSPAGAIGLMQLIPPTGRSTAEEVGISGYKTDMLYIPRVNVELGIAYFKKVLEDFNGNPHLALGSYNGGPHNVVKWITKLGNLDADEFVEEIPFYETRNYVKRVLRSYGAYKAIYDKEFF